jgi:hypothetical protein
MPIGPLKVGLPEWGRIILVDVIFFIGFVTPFEFLSDL